MYVRRRDGRPRAKRSNRKPAGSEEQQFETVHLHLDRRDFRGRRGRTQTIIHSQLRHKLRKIYYYL